MASGGQVQFCGMAQKTFTVELSVYPGCELGSWDVSAMEGVGACARVGPGANNHNAGPEYFLLTMGNLAKKKAMSRMLGPYYCISAVRAPLTYAG